MNSFKSFASKLYEVNDGTFDNIALELFRYQSQNNKLYSIYIKNRKVDPFSITRLEDIPFLPISFFKTHAVKTGEWTEAATFSSSGTTGSVQSKHHVPDLQFYLEHSARCFELQFGPLTDYHFLALLPSYLERSGSSLISMIAHFIDKSGSEHSGFFLHEYDALLRKIADLRDDNRKIILWGVSFALLDLAEKYTADLSHCLVFETGGMKGRRKEITRQELHDVLSKALKVDAAYSEYGMTELMSQAYTTGTTAFQSPPFFKVLGRDVSDPFEVGIINETAALNVIDLANFHSIAFIETEDLGKNLQEWDV